MPVLLKALTAAIPLFLALAAVVALIGVFCFVRHRSRRNRLPAILGAVCMFGAIGIMIGYGMGASRIPAVAAVLPAVLTLLGAALAYLFKNQRIRNAAWNAASLPAISSLVLTCLLATIIGGQARLTSEARDRYVTQCEDHRKDIITPVCVSTLIQVASGKMPSDADGKRLAGICAQFMLRPPSCE